jgi:hypothetical protein
VPYDTLTADTVNEAIQFMQFLYTSDAVALAVARQPKVLALLGSSAQATTPSYRGAEPPQSLHEVYADGILLAELQQLEKASPAVVDATLTALDAALPATLTPDDAIPIALDRRRYALLGKALPDLAHPAHPVDANKPVALTSLNVPSRVPYLPAHHAITALLLFPDWCAQCIRMATKLPPTVFTVAGHEAYLYGLLAETVPPNPPTATPTARTTVTAADAANFLRGTPTVVVDASWLDQFAVNDLPFLLVCDAEGIVRVVEAVSDDALTPGGTIDAAIAHVGEVWPSPLLRAPFPSPGTKADTPTGTLPH